MLEIVSYIFMILACVLGAICVIGLLMLLMKWISRRRVSKDTIASAKSTLSAASVTGTLSGANFTSTLSVASIDKNKDISNGQIGWLCRNGVAILKKPCGFVLSKVKFVDRAFEDAVFLLDEKGILSDKVALASSALGLGLLLAIIVAVIFRSPIAGVAVVLLVFVCFYTSIKSALEKRSDRIRAEIPDTLRTMGSCFQSGYTLQQTFQFLADEGDGAVNKIFAKCSNVLQAGGTITKSLDGLKSETSAPELVFIAVALDVQHQTGGSMGPVIESARDMVESKLDLLQKLKVQTAQAKLSARVVTILPFALIAVFSVVSPGFLAPFFSSFLGLVVFAVACTMQAAGIIIVRKMLEVKV